MAGSIIKARTFSSVVDNKIQLTNSQCARQWSTSLGTNWTKIRVGARVAITHTGASLSGTPRFAFGIQSGTTNLFQDAGGPTNWVGFVSNGTWANHTGNGIPGYYLATGMTMARKIGTTLTTGGSTNDFCIYWDATQAYRSCLFADITKGTPNFTASCFCYNIANAFVSGPDVSLATYLANVVLPSPSVSSHAMSGNITLAVSESSGSLDSVGIAWDRTDALIEVSDVTVVRLS